ncbi:GDYXXLXY domain-containing protein [Halobacillus salinarum]|uniref:GDYXXLXY domain-containing protein n=1 Tax=Halobacillus salinarum TaxID=2932257 RepID=A0ABY4EIX9_9BACI|nr:GDYXXLXY domain-containing protein [Halobacillus salinarum]UOQ43472.1 GDYXXLXY domain-containing protein [Halobacillus salinarum]
MKKIVFYVFVGLQVLFLVLMCVSYYAMDSFGTTIKLKTTPIDPRDPFYGDFVSLGYQVEQIPEKYWEGNKEANRGEQVDLLLKKDKSGVYRLKKASNRKLEASTKDQIVIKAKYEGHNSFAGEYRVSLGLDRYYVEEGMATQIQPNEERVVEIVIAPWGQKKIASLSEEK